MGRTADETLGEGRLLLPADVPSPPLANAVAFQKTWDTPVRTFREAGQGVSTGLEPIATSARRAVNLFLKEIPDEGRDQGRKAG
jgi:hypothetical protein